MESWGLLDRRLDAKMGEEASGRDYYDQVESMTNKTDHPTSPMLAACRWGILDVVQKCLSLAQVVDARSPRGATSH